MLWRQVRSNESKRVKTRSNWVTDIRKLLSPRLSFYEIQSRLAFVMNTIWLNPFRFMNLRNLRMRNNLLHKKVHTIQTVFVIQNKCNNMYFTFCILLQNVLAYLNYNTYCYWLCDDWPLVLCGSSANIGDVSTRLSTNHYFKKNLDTLLFAVKVPIYPKKI